MTAADDLDTRLLQRVIDRARVPFGRARCACTAIVVVAQPQRRTVGRPTQPRHLSRRQRRVGTGNRARCPSVRSAQAERHLHIGLRHGPQSPRNGPLEILAPRVLRRCHRATLPMENDLALAGLSPAIHEAARGTLSVDVTCFTDV